MAQYDNLQSFQDDFIHNNFHSWQNSTSEVRVEKYYLLFSFLFVHFFFLLLGKKKKRTKKEKTSYSKDTVNDFISDFSVTSYCKNHLKIKLCLTNRASGLRPEPQTSKGGKKRPLRSELQKVT